MVRDSSRRRWGGSRGGRYWKCFSFQGLHEVVRTALSSTKQSLLHYTGTTKQSFSHPLFFAYILPPAVLYVLSVSRASPLFDTQYNAHADDDVVVRTHSHDCTPSTDSPDVDIIIGYILHHLPCAVV